MITVIARLTMLEGKEDEAVAHCAKMAGAVEANEPNALAYLVHRSKDNPLEIVFFEVYADDATLKAHGETPHMGEFRSRLAELFDLTKVKIERLDRAGGFARSGAS
jgi:quinol monooxygenase YgiN